MYKSNFERHQVYLLILVNFFVPGSIYAVIIRIQIQECQINAAAAAVFTI